MIIVLYGDSTGSACIFWVEPNRPQPSLSLNIVARPPTAPPCARCRVRVHPVSSTGGGRDWCHMARSPCRDWCRMWRSRRCGPHPWPQREKAWMGLGQLCWPDSIVTIDACRPLAKIAEVGFIRCVLEVDGIHVSHGFRPSRPCSARAPVLFAFADAFCSAQLPSLAQLCPWVSLPWSCAPCSRPEKLQASSISRNQWHPPPPRMRGTLPAGPRPGVELDQKRILRPLEVKHPPQGLLTLLCSSSNQMREDIHPL